MVLAGPSSAQPAPQPLSLLDVPFISQSDALLATELGRGRPVLTLIEDRPGAFHYIVAVGLTADAIVFHDPARAPMRVMGRDEFTRRWDAADRWMAVVLPGA